MTSNSMRCLSVGAFILAVGLAGTASSAEIPASFHGAGCNLKYTYARAPKGDASDCINAKAGRKDGEGHDNDNFIRITKTGVAGVEWGCEVKSIKSVAETELTFDAACGDEGTESAGTVMLLMRPGRQIIVDQIVDGQHIIDIYRLRDDLK